MPEQTIHQVRKLISYDDPWGNEYRAILCPVCKYEYNHILSSEKIEGEDSHKAPWQGRGDLVLTKMRCENWHEWELCLGFHKGQSFIFIRTTEAIKINYYEYIQSPVWRAKAEAAKERAGHRCQVCNRGKADGVILNAHHRTYERLGNELPEDITVLCKHCHELYEKNKSNIKAVTA